MPGKPGGVKFWCKCCLFPLGAADRMNSPEEGYCLVCAVIRENLRKALTEMEKGNPVRARFYANLADVPLQDAAAYRRGHMEGKV